MDSIKFEEAHNQLIERKENRKREVGRKIATADILDDVFIAYQMGMIAGYKMALVGKDLNEQNSMGITDQNG